MDSESEVSQSTNENNIAEGQLELSENTVQSFVEFDVSRSTGETTTSFRERWSSRSADSNSLEDDIIENECNIDMNNDEVLQLPEVINAINILQPINDNPIDDEEYASVQSHNEYYNVNSFDDMDEISSDEEYFDVDDYAENNHGDDFATINPKLTELLDDNEANTTISANIIVNKIEMLLAVLMFAKAYSLPNSGVADLCKMINSFMDKAILPDSRYMIDKLFYPATGIEYHAVCSVCKQFVKKFNKNDRRINCVVCEKVINLKDPCYNNFFVTLSINSELQMLLEQNEEYYSDIMNGNAEQENLTDFHDGQKYKEFVTSLPEHCRRSYVTLVFNSDGSPIFKSSKFSIWPIQVYPNEIPPAVRNKRQLTCALWFGHDKPNMNIFMGPFVKNLNKLSEVGIPCKINNEIKSIHVYALCCCVDTVARAPIQGFIQFNGYFGCNWCLHPGKLVYHGRGRSIKYPLLNDLPQRRTEEMTLLHIQEAIDTNCVIYGVKKATPVLNLTGFNIIDGFVPDAMHCVALGVVKQFSEYWFNTSNFPYSISKNDISSINKHLMDCKVPTQIARLSRSLSVRKFWTSRELENWLLYYSLPVLKHVIGFEKYSKHWSLLVEAIHLLMSDCITKDELLKADNLLKHFIAETELLYSESAMTFNVHQLVHLAQSVADWGPLWTHFGYPFESGNGQIIKTVHAAKGVLSQICRNFAVRESVFIMQKHIDTQLNSPVKEYCSYLENRCTANSIQIGGNRYFGKSYKPDDRITRNLDALPDNILQNIKSYRKLIKNQCVFKSCKRQLQRTDNSYAQTKCNKYIKIVEFLVDQETNLEYTLYQVVTVEPFSNICASVKKVLRVEETVNIIETSALVKLCVSMYVNNYQYISTVPHMYWYS